MRFAIRLAVLGLVAGLPLIADTVLSVNGNCASQGALNQNFVFGEYWSQTSTYLNATVSLAVTTSPSTNGSPISVYLTRKTGSGTTTADEVAHGTFTIPAGTAAGTLIPVLSGLTLNPGNYFLSAYAPSSTNAGGWCVATGTPTIVTGTGVTQQNTYLLNSGAAYLPAGGFNRYWSPAQFAVTGTPPGPPVINQGGVVPAYSSSTTISPGSWISIFGSNFAGGNSLWNGDFPITLGGVTVTIDNKPAYLWAVTPSQINAQVPDDATTGNVPVVVSNAFGSGTATATLSPVAPSFLLYDAAYVAGVIPTPDGSGAYGGGTYDLLGPSGHFSFATRPAREGEFVELFATGFGPTNPAVPAGKIYTSAAPNTMPTTISVGGSPQTVTCYLVGAGLNQCNVKIPTVGSGDKALQATVGGFQTQKNIALSVIAAGQNLTPAITSISPTPVVPGAATTITISGANFLASSTATFNGTSHAVSFVSSTRLTMNLAASDIPSAGSYPIIVTNPSPGGGPSNTVTLAVAAQTLNIGGKTFSFTGPLSIAGTSVTLEVQVVASGGSYTIVVDDSLSASSPVQITAAFNAAAAITGNTASFSGAATTGVYTNTSNTSSPVIATVSAVALTVNFSSASPTSGSSVSGTLTLTTSAGTLQGTFTGTLGAIS